MKWRLSVGEILEALGQPETRGAFDGEITGVADLRAASASDLSFLGSGKYARYVQESDAGVVIVPLKQEGEPRKGRLWILAEDPSLALGAVCRSIGQLIKPAPEPGVHPTAHVDPAAEIDPGASIGPFCVVGARARISSGVILESHVRIEQDAVIGEDTLIQHGAVVGWSCRIGRRCRLFAGSVVGSDGFGYNSDGKGHQLLPQIGIAVLEDDVDLGANSTVDRARFAETRIGQGSKLDNLVQVGHNVIMGKHCILCAAAAVAGSAQLGNFVILAGQVGVSGHIKIGDGVIATGQTGITKDVPPKAVLTGTPARPRMEELKKLALVAQLPAISARLKELEEKLSGD